MELIFDNCSEHTFHGTNPVAHAITNFPDNSLLYKASHIHCYECACIQSRKECPLKVLGEQALTEPFREPLISLPSVEVKSADVSFNVSWSEQDDVIYRLEGLLPSLLAAEVLKTISR